MKSLDLIFQMKNRERQHYFPVVLFIMTYKVVLDFEPADGNQKCNHSG